MKKPIESKSCNAIMDSAKSLFWKYGIRRVTVEEICREAGVSKMTYYRLFKNKNDVAEKVLDKYLSESMQDYRNVMNQQISYPEKMKQVIVLKKESSENISEEFLKDIYQIEDSGLSQLMHEFTVSSIAEVLEDYKTAQKEGWIRQNLKLEFILYIQDQLTNMVIDKNLLSMYNNPQEVIMEVTNFFFYGILSDKKSTS